MDIFCIKSNHILFQFVYGCWWLFFWKSSAQIWLSRKNFDFWNRDWLCGACVLWISQPQSPFHRSSSGNSVPHRSCSTVDQPSDSQLRCHLLVLWNVLCTPAQVAQVPEAWLCCEFPDGRWTQWTIRHILGAISRFALGVLCWFHYYCIFIYMSSGCS